MIAMITVITEELQCLQQLECRVCNLCLEIIVITYRLEQVHKHSSYTLLALTLHFKRVQNVAFRRLKSLFNALKHKYFRHVWDSHSQRGGWFDTPKT